MSAADARAVAERYLDPALPRRWEHVRGVGARGEEIAARLGLLDEFLAAAAWLHDVMPQPLSESDKREPRPGHGRRDRPADAGRSSAADTQPQGQAASDSGLRDRPGRPRASLHADLVFSRGHALAWQSAVGVLKQAGGCGCAWL